MLPKESSVVVFEGGCSGDGMYAGWRRVGERNRHPGSGREVYLNRDPDEKAMYGQGRRYGGAMVLVAGGAVEI
jgi:hypothetical protein